MNKNRFNVGDLVRFDNNIIHAHQYWLILKVETIEVCYNNLGEIDIYTCFNFYTNSIFWQHDDREDCEFYKIRNIIY